MSAIKGISRRSVLKSASAAAAGLALPMVWTGNRAFGAERITVSDVGGAVGDAIKQAFYLPFEQETGIQVVGVAHDPDPVTQFKLLVDAKSYIWDVAMVTQDHVVRLTTPDNYLEPLNVPAEEAADLLPGMLTDNWMGFSVFGIVMAYRTDTMGEHPPTGWRDYWNSAAFPGRRGLYKSPWGVLEMALIADGVSPKALYPLDVDRAFAKLDEIRPDVAVWWGSGAQNTQTLQNGEVDLSDTWTSRASTAIASGAPVKIVWDGLYSVDGWSIPAGTPRADLAREFVRFCMRPEQQAIYASLSKNGPSNTRAFEHISPEHAAVMPTAKENFQRLGELDSAWWGENYDAMAERFQEWLLLG